MSSKKWWAVYRSGQHVLDEWAVSGERALDAVSEQTGIPLEELDAVDHDAMEIGPEFSEPGPAVPGMEVV